MTLEEQYRNTFKTLIPDADWASVRTLEQPSPLKHIDSVTMPNTYIDPDLLQGCRLSPLITP